MTSSHRQILKSSAIIGSSSVLNILLSLLRMRIVAAVVGPAGIGLLGLLQSMVQTGAAVGGLGVGSAAAREIAAEPTAHDQARARRAVRLATLVLAPLAGAGTGLVVHLAGADWGGPAVDGAAWWVGVATALTVVTASQLGVLTGLRQIGDVARATILSALLVTLVALVAVFVLPVRGALLAIVLATPLASAIVGQLLLRRHRPVAVEAEAAPALRRRLAALASIGVALCATGIIGSAGPLLLRVVVGDRMGPVALGCFQAAWTIAALYIGVVLQAMGTDFLPRLSASADDPPTYARLVREQMEAALLLGGPVIVAMTALSPFVITLLYGRAFAPGSDLLGLLLVGDGLKLLAWPLGFALIARRRTASYIALELGAMLILVVASAGLVPSFGLVGVGAAYIAMYVAYVGAGFLAVRRAVPGFAVPPRILAEAALLVLLAAAGHLLASSYPFVAAAFGLLSAAGLAASSLRRLAALGALPRLSALGRNAG